jgi:hypothetical protein
MVPRFRLTSNAGSIGLGHGVVGKLAGAKIPGDNADFKSFNQLIMLASIRPWSGMNDSKWLVTQELPDTDATAHLLT